MLYVKPWLKRRGMKQKDLADALGWSPAMVSKHLRGWTDWTEPKIVAAAKALDITPCDLFRHPDTVSVDAIIRDLPDGVKGEVAEFARYQLKKMFPDAETSVDRPH